MSETNGTLAHSLSEARQQARLARLRLEKVRAEHEARQLESFMGAGFGSFGPQLDPFRFGWNTGGMGTWLPPGFGGRAQDRKDGVNRPFIWTEQHLEWMRGQSAVLEAENDVAKGVLRSLTNYTVKVGYTWEAVPTDPADKTACELAKLVQRVVDEFNDVNLCGQVERDQFYWSRVDGESIVRFFAEPDGTTLVRPVESCQLRTPRGVGPEWLFGYRTNPRDVLTFEEFALTYQGDRPDDVEYVHAEDIAFLKLNVRPTVKRGLSDFYSSGESLRQAEQLLDTLTTVGHIQAKVPWIEQYNGLTRAGLLAAISAKRAQNVPQGPDPLTGREPSYQQLVTGEIPHVGEGKEYIPQPSAGNAPNHIAVVGARLRSLGARWGMPEFLISGDASNNNYASIFVSGGPWVQAVECEQVYYLPHYLRWRWVAVRNAARAGLLVVNGHRYSPEEVQRLVDIVGTPPQVAISNKQEEASVDHQDLEAKVISPQHRAAKLGVDFDKIQADWKAAEGKGEDGDGGPDGKPAEAVQDAGLRGTVGGSQQVAALQTAFYKGELPREAAVANAVVVFGFTDEQADRLFPNVAPKKLAPDEPKGTADPSNPLSAALGEAILKAIRESCEPNKRGTGHHDEHGRPCSPGTGGESTTSTAPNADASQTRTALDSAPAEVQSQSWFGKFKDLALSAATRVQVLVADHGETLASLFAPSDATKGGMEGGKVGDVIDSLEALSDVESLGDLGDLSPGTVKFLAETLAPIVTSLVGKAKATAGAVVDKALAGRRAKAVELAKQKRERNRASKAAKRDKQAARARTRESVEALAGGLREVEGDKAVAAAQALVNALAAIYDALEAAHPPLLDSLPDLPTAEEVADEMRAKSGTVTEGCIPNKTGPGYHDNTTGHPCAAPGGETGGLADSPAKPKHPPLADVVKAGPPNWAAATGDQKKQATASALSDLGMTATEALTNSEAVEKVRKHLESHGVRQRTFEVMQSLELHQQLEDPDRARVLPAMFGVTSKQQNNPRLADAKEQTDPPNLTQGEKVAQQVYSYGGDGPMNKALRKGEDVPAEYAPVHERMQRAFAKAGPIGPPPAKVVRGMSLDGDGLNSFLAAAVAAQKTGEPLQMNGYISTATADRVPSSFAGNVDLHIAAVHGLDMMTRSHFPQEKELLLNHGSQFRVTQVMVDRNGKYKVFMEQVPPEKHRAGAVTQDAHAGSAMPDVPKQKFSFLGKFKSWLGMESRKPPQTEGADEPQIDPDRINRFVDDSADHIGVGEATQAAMGEFGSMDDVLAHIQSTDA